MSSFELPCAPDSACCAAINKLYSRLYQLVRTTSVDVIGTDQKAAFLAEIIEIAKLSTNAIYEQLKCQDVLCCVELDEDLYKVFEKYILHTNRTKDKLIVRINRILVPAEFPEVVLP